MKQVVVGLKSGHETFDNSLHKALKSSSTIYGTTKGSNRSSGKSRHMEQEPVIGKPVVFVSLFFNIL